MEIPVCPQCGRLMAEETGPLCDKCAPVPVQAAGPLTTPEPWVTWTLVAVTAVASAVGLTFTDEKFPLGAQFGPDIAGGEWWRLLTSFFVHNSLGHFVWNMLPLWFFGSRLERILGHWTFLGFYLACGLTGNVVSVIANPEVPSAGASGAVFGVCAGLFVHYALRIRALSRKQRIRLTVLGMYLWAWFWQGFANIHVDQAGHIGGLSAGVILGCVLSLPFGEPRRVSIMTFAAAAIILAVGAIEFRQRNLYLVHLDAAAKAIQSGKDDIAAYELRVALEMKPDSPVGKFLQEKLDKAAR